MPLQTPHPQDSLLDKAVLPMGRFEELPAIVQGQGGQHGQDGSGAGAGPAEPAFLHLNGASLESLEILENSDGGSTGAFVRACGDKV